jgi:hypothetical protein
LSENLTSNIQRIKLLPSPRRLPVGIALLCVSSDSSVVGERRY